MKDKLEKLLEKNWIAQIVAACVAVLFYIVITRIYLIGNILRFLSPVLWGIVIAYILNPLVNLVEDAFSSIIKKDKIRHPFAVVITLVIVFLVIVVFVATIIPAMVKSISGIVENVELYAINLQGYLNTIAVFMSKFNIDISHFLTASEDVINNTVEWVSNNADTIASTFFDVGMSIANIVIGIVIAVYFMMDKNKIASNINRLRKLSMKEKTYAAHNIFWKKCNEILSRFIIFDIIDGLIIGLANALFMAILSMPNITLISVFMGITNMIPTFGPIVGALLGMMVLLLTNPMDALLFIVFTVIIQAIDASIIKPKLFGNSFGVPAVWIFIAIILGGKAVGVLGILLAIPFVAIVTYIFSEMILPRLEGKNNI